MENELLKTLLFAIIPFIATVTSAIFVYISSSKSRSLEEKIIHINQKHQLELKKLDFKIQTTLSNFQDVTIPRQKILIDHMEKTYLLLPRIFTSFTRLARLAPSLDQSDLLTETTNTLDLYAEYHQHLSISTTVSYPKELRDHIDNIQESLAFIFLELQLNGQGSQQLSANNRLMDRITLLKEQKDSSIDIISQLLQVPIQISMDGSISSAADPITTNGGPKAGQAPTQSGPKAPQASRIPIS